MSTNSFSKHNKCLIPRILRTVPGIHHPSLGFINMFIAWPGDRFLLCTLKGYWELMDCPFSKTKFPQYINWKVPICILSTTCILFQFKSYVVAFRPVTIKGWLLDLSENPRDVNKTFPMSMVGNTFSLSSVVGSNTHNLCSGHPPPLCPIVSMLGNKRLVCSRPQCARQLLPYYTLHAQPRHLLN